MFKKMAYVVATCVLIAAILALVTPPALATDFSWDGNFNSLWDRTSATDRTNWDPQGMSSPIPNWNDNVFFGDISADRFTVDLNGNRTVLSATFSGSDDYTLIGSGDRLKLSTGNLTASGLATHAITCQVELGADGVWAINNPEFVVSGDVIGAFALTKTGVGTLTLTGDNSYTGVTTISGGVLQIGDGGTTGSIVGDVTNNASLIFSRSDDLTFGGEISGTGSLTKLGAGALTLTGDNSYAGGTTINGGTLTLGHSSAAGAGAITVLGSTIDYADGINVANLIDLQNDVTLNVTTGAATQSGVIGETGGSFGVIKMGSGALTLSAANTFSDMTNIEAGSIIVGHANALQYSTVSINVNNGLDVTTNSIDATIGALAGTGSLSLGSQSLTAGGNDASTTYSGTISGTGWLNKDGTGALTLTGNNSYTGDTNISAGTLIATGTDERIPDSTAVRIDPGATFEVDGITETIDGLKNFAGAVVLSNGATLQIMPTSLRIFPGTFTGDADTTLAMLGGSAPRLDAASPDFFGTTLITGGNIQINHANALQNSTVDIQANNGLDVTTNAIDATIGGLEGSGNLSLGSQSLTVGANGADTIYSGRILGTTDSILSHDGAGTLTLTGSSISNFGTLRAESGAVVVDHAGMFLSSTDVSFTTGALLATGGDITIGNGAVVQMPTGSVGFVLDGALAVTGTNSSLSGGDRLFVAHHANTTGSLLVEDSALLGLSGGLLIGFVGDGELRVQSSGNASTGNVFLGIQTGASGDAVVTGANSALSTNNLHFGGQSDTILGGVGTLAVESGAEVQVAQQTIFWSGASSMTINGGSLETDKLTNHTGVTATVSLTDPAGGVALTVGTNDGSSTFDGLIEGTGSLAKLGTGTFTLTGENTFSGTTNIDAGSIILDHADALGDSTVSINVADGLDVTTNSINATIGALAGSGDLNIGSQNLSIGSNNDDTIYSGALTGSSGGSVDKRGTGTLTLTGTGSGFGHLTARNGAAVIDGGNYTTGSSNMTIHESGTLIVQNSGLFQHGGLNDIRGSLIVETSGTFATNALRTFGSNADITVQSGGTFSTAGAQNLAYDAGSSVTYLVTGTDSSVSAQRMTFGGTPSTTGGTVAMTVSDNGHVGVTDDTEFRTATSSLIVNGGTFSTGTLTSDSGVIPTISITDPVGGVALTVGTNNGSSTFDGLIEGTGSLAKAGSGTFTLTRANTFAGMTSIDGGSIILSHANALQDSTVSINVDDGLDVLTYNINARIGALAGTGHLDLGSQELITGGNGTSTTYSGVLSGSNNSILNHGGAGTLTLAGGPSTVGTLLAESGPVVLDGASIDLTSTDSSTTTGALLANFSDITIRGGADVRMGTGMGYVQGGALLTITGAGSSLTGNRLNVAESLVLTGSIVVEESASLGLTGNLRIGYLGEGDLTVQAGATASADEVLLGIEKVTVPFTITGIGDALVTGPGSLLSSNSLHLGGESASVRGGTGTLTVEDGGAVQVAGETKIWSSASSITINGGSLDTDQLTNHTGVVATVSITDPAGGTALTVGTHDGSSIFDGLIEGTGSLQKVGAGTFTLTEANTYSGGTIIAAGTLLAGNTTGSATGSGAVQVNSGGTLGGTGSVAGPVTVASGGTIAPGASPGTLSLGDNLVLDPSSTLAIEIAGLLPGVEHDLLNVTGDVTLNGASLTVEGISPITEDGQPIYGDKQLTILNAASVSGSFDSIPRSYGAEAAAQGLTGNDIVPNLGDPLGPDVYIPSLDANVPDNAGLWFGNASDEATGENGVYISLTKADIGVFQAAPGDTDGNRKVEGPDILRILTASQFGDGLLVDGNGDYLCVWGTGDFDGNHKVEGPDILLLLTESLFGDGTYGDKGPAVFPAAGAGGDVKLVVTEDGLVIDAGDTKINGFVLSSQSGILTGDDANNLGLFQEDTDDMISGAFAMALKGEHALGDVIGQTDVDLTGDLTLTYTLVGQPGLFTASVVVPEPGTLMLLLSGLAALLIWRRGLMVDAAVVDK